MSFSKSKVERFPRTVSSSREPNSMVSERKRTFINSGLSKSAPKFTSSNLRTGILRENTMKKVSSLNISSNTPTTSIRGQNSFERTLLTPTKGRSRVFLSKRSPGPSKSHPGRNAEINCRSANGLGKNFNPNRKPARLSLSKNNGSATRSTLLTPKRKRNDESLSEIFFTPLTTPLNLSETHMNSFETIPETTPSVKQASSCLELWTVLPLFESTGIFDTPLDEIVSFESKDHVELDSVEKPSMNDNETSTITTLGRKPMRRSFPRWSSSARIIDPGPMTIQTDDNDWSFQPNVSLQSSEWSRSSDLLNYALIEAFDYDHVEFHVPSDPVAEHTSVDNSTSIFARAGRMLSSLFAEKKKVLPDDGFKDQSNHEFELPPKNRRPNNDHVMDLPRRIMSEYLSVSLPALYSGRRMMRRRASRELRNMLRTVRVEARRTLREVKLSIVVPTKDYFQSQEFWMPILEFVAGQVVEIIRTKFE